MNHLVTTDSNNFENMTVLAWLNWDQCCFTGNARAIKKDEPIYWLQWRQLSTTLMMDDTKLVDLSINQPKITKTYYDAVRAIDWWLTQLPVAAGYCSWEVWPNWRLVSANEPLNFCNLCCYAMNFHQSCNHTKLINAYLYDWISALATEIINNNIGSTHQNTDQGNIRQNSSLLSCQHKLVPTSRRIMDT